MDREQEAQLRRDMAREDTSMRSRASQSPLGPAAPRPRPTAQAPAAAPNKPAVEPYAPGPPASAEQMGGKLDDPNADYRIEVGPDMVPRRVPKAAPGPQSSAEPGTMGARFSNDDANRLVATVRHGRMARHAATIQTPTFGDVAQQTQDQELAQAQQPAQPQAPDPQQVAQIAASIRFVADTRHGHIEPVMPGDDPPALGPHDILFSPGQDPSQPNILDKGKRVTDAAIARLANPQRNIQPTLRPGYKVPPQYAHIADALGLGGKGGA